MSYAIMAPKQSLEFKPFRLKNNFGLSYDEFCMYQQKLIAEDESLLKFIAENHFKVCIKYLTYNCKISEDIAYDTCLDTMLDFRDKILSGKIEYGNLSYLFTRMAKNTYINSYNKKTKVEDAIDIFTNGDDTYKENENLFFEILDHT